MSYKLLFLSTLSFLENQKTHDFFPRLAQGCPFNNGEPCRSSDVFRVALEPVRGTAEDGTEPGQKSYGIVGEKRGISLSKMGIEWFINGRYHQQFMGYL